MKCTILVLTLTLLLSIASTASASTGPGSVNNPAGNIPAESAALIDPANLQIPTNATMVITSLVALLY